MRNEGGDRSGARRAAQGPVQAYSSAETAAAITSFIMGAMLQLGIDAGAFDFHHVSGELDRWLAPPPGKPARGRKA
ncbi:hypothetical protein BE04_38805 [Sorangium cellulosum]|uniref:Uncharacterized protein n=2 Tax=Sorangium cellulosum TaxID=56 RepID=A0A150P3E7_SORCE|nr:hypothetical protein [Sorangium cellulosum]AGP33330.1 hypothetical protein SCE1572_01675 [Sorangium cellulosum So0157-2]KYF50171.1 hypothetical protein BE04_38805 [Sorangium cellulosum]